MSIINSNLLINIIRTYVLQMITINFESFKTFNNKYFKTLFVFFLRITLTITNHQA